MGCFLAGRRKKLLPVLYFLVETPNDMEYNN